MTSPVRDALTDLPVLASERVFEGMVWTIRAEVVDLGGRGGVVRREFKEHTGAVAVLALSTEGRVLLLRQYRHPVRSHLWELPAGLLDEPGETWLEAARRELAEEADLTAARWDTLVDFYTSPGGSDEFIRVYLARDLAPTPTPHPREGEEADMRRAWVALEEAADLALAGQLHNPATVAGILAAQLGHQRRWATLRPADAPFELKPSRRR